MTNLIYSFSYRDCEHDVYEREFNNMQDCMKCIRRLQADDCEIIETWIHKEDGTFVKRFNF